MVCLQFKGVGVSAGKLQHNPRVYMQILLNMSLQNIL